jgi:hypothetical protein
MALWATVEWLPEDIKTLKPEWSDEECLSFLERNETKIRDRIIELGWEVITSFVKEDEHYEGKDNI